MAPPTRCGEYEGTLPHRAPLDLRGVSSVRGNLPWCGSLFVGRKVSLVQRRIAKFVARGAKARIGFAPYAYSVRAQTRAHIAPLNPDQLARPQLLANSGTLRLCRHFAIIRRGTKTTGDGEPRHYRSANPAAAGRSNRRVGLPAVGRVRPGCRGEGAEIERAAIPTASLVE